MIPDTPFYRALLTRQSSTVLEPIVKAKVAVIGLGGLGSHGAMALARCGVRDMRLIDDDEVELSNIHRQLYLPRDVGQKKVAVLTELLLALNPEGDFQPLPMRVTATNLAKAIGDADYVLECVDDAATKAMITETILTTTQKTLITANGMAGMGPIESLQTKRRHRRWIDVGDGVSDVNQEGALVATRVMACAAMQAHALFTLLTKGDL